ncbi:hypothetical protein BDW75DRAFT_225944 [Aspergillus navahoensis]
MALLFFFFRSVFYSIPASPGWLVGNWKGWFVALLICWVWGLCPVGLRHRLRILEEWNGFADTAGGWCGESCRTGYTMDEVLMEGLRLVQLGCRSFEYKSV